MKALGVTFDSTLSFASHIKKVARTASQKLGSLRRILHLLNSESAQQLYKAQVRSVMEYACLTWNGAASSHLSLLDKIQRRAGRLMSHTWSASQDIHLQSLQHRRDVSGLTVLYKAQQMDVSHLSPLKQQWRRRTYSTREADHNIFALEVPRVRTSQYQRHFVYRYVNMWNDKCKEIM